MSKKPDADRFIDDLVASIAVVSLAALVYRRHPGFFAKVLELLAGGRSTSQSPRPPATLEEMRARARELLH